MPLQTPTTLALDCQGVLQASLTLVLSLAQQSFLKTSQRRGGVQVRQLLLEMVRLQASLEQSQKESVRLNSLLARKDATIAELLTLNEKTAQELAVSRRVSARVSRHLNLPLKMQPEHEAQLAKSLPHLKLQTLEITQLRARVTSLRTHNLQLAQALATACHESHWQQAYKARDDFLVQQLEVAKHDYEQLQAEFTQYEDESDRYYY